MTAEAVIALAALTVIAVSGWAVAAVHARHVRALKELLRARNRTIRVQEAELATRRQLAGMQLVAAWERSFQQAAETGVAEIQGRGTRGHITLVEGGKDA